MYMTPSSILGDSFRCIKFEFTNNYLQTVGKMCLLTFFFPNIQQGALKSSNKEQYLGITEYFLTGPDL